MGHNRNVVEAAATILELSDDELLNRAKHDPDMFRDIAAAYISSRDILRPFAAKAKKWRDNHPSFNHNDSRQLQHRYGDFKRAEEFILKGNSTP